MIDRYHLRYFLAVIDHGNFSKAAIACNVAQPTLSAGIAKLEKSLQRQLFLRTNRRVELTEQGAHLATYARSIEASFAEAERMVSEASSVERIRIGILGSVPADWIEQFLAGRRALGSNTQVEIVVGRERELSERLNRNRLDVALTLLRVQAEDEALIYSEGYSLALPADHRLARCASIDAEELADEPMIVRRHCELLAETSRHFTARGVRPFFPARTTSEERALSYVRAGLGITIMPDCFEGAGVARCPLKDFDFRRDIGLVYAPSRSSERLRDNAVLRYLRETIAGLANR